MKYFHKTYEGAMLDSGFSLDWRNKILYIRWNWGKRHHQIRIRHYWAGWTCSVRHAPIGARYWDKASIKTHQGRIEVGRKK